MATLTVQTLNRSGITPTYAAAGAGGDSTPTDTDTFLHIKNGGGGAITATVITTGILLGDVSIVDVTVSVPAGGERMIGPLPYEHFAHSSDGLTDITYSGVTSVTVGVFRVQQP